MRLKYKTGKTVVVGLTGGYGTGKSLVLKEFGRQGAAMLSSDEIAREVYNRSTVLRRISKEFKTTDRKEVAGIIFADPARRAALESIMHPLIMKELKAGIRRIKASRARLVVAEVPLLFEAGLAGLFDAVVAVRCRKDVLLHRVCARDHISRAEALRRLSSQMPAAEKARLSDFVVDNSGGRAGTVKQVKKILDKIL
jgi:dephospho-CoA kinase